MKKPALLVMSLLTFVIGCFSGSGSKKEAAAPKEYPRFPETDAADVKFTRVALDSDFVMKTFFISPDKHSIYVLAYKEYSNGNPDDPARVQRTDLRMFALNETGAITHRLDMKHVDNSWGSSLGMIGDEVMLLTGDNFIVLNTKTFTVAEKIPVWYTEHFPTRKEIELMTPDEQRDAYNPLFEHAIKDNVNCRFLLWPSGKYYVFVQGPPGKRAAWDPPSYQTEDINALKKQMLPIDVSDNPHVSTDAGGDNYTVVDGAVKLREADLLPGGQELDYPNYKTRHIMQYELAIGSKVVHFSTTDRKRYDLRVGLADNRYLTTADGAVWMRYMSVLYRVQ